MAEVLRYINTASSGGDGTTNGESGATAAYASLTAWEAAEQTDLVSAGDTHRVVCSVGSGSAADTAVIPPTITGWTTNDTYYIVIEAASGEEAGTEWDETKYRLEMTPSSTTNGLYMQETGRIKNLQIKTTNSSSQAGNVLYAVPGGYLEITGNYLWNNSAKTSGGWLWGVRLLGAFSRDTIVANNVVYLNGNGASYTWALIRGITARDGYVYNNTIRVVDAKINASTDIERCALHGDLRAVFKNNLVDVSGGGLGTYPVAGLAGSYTTEDYNASTDATLVGGNSRNSQTFDFVSATDHAITASDTGAKDYGVDLSSDTTYSFSVDIIGTTRPEGSAWDIGAFEALATGFYGTPYYIEHLMRGAG